jgi:outer membrane protein (TIGR04327 family)
MTKIIMKKITLTTIFFLSSFTLLAEPGKQTFETGIKALKAQFIPYEYSRDFSDAEPLIGYSIKKLKNNSKVINPFFIIYKNFEKGFGVEFDYTHIQIHKANYESQYYYRNEIYINKEYLRNNERSDYRLNFFFYPSDKLKEYFAFGAGLRKIDRIRNAEKDNFTAEEKIISFGPQIVFKSKIPLSESLSLDLGLDLFHTQGKRNYYFLDSQLSYARSGAFSSLDTITQNGKTLGIFQGFQADIALKYNFLEHFNLAVGYNYNYSYFKYQNLGDTYYYFSTLSNYGYFENSKLSNGKEIIRGFYISASTVF